HSLPFTFCHVSVRLRSTLSPAGSIWNLMRSSTLCRHQCFQFLHTRIPLIPTLLVWVPLHGGSNVSRRPLLAYCPFYHKPGLSRYISSARAPRSLIALPLCRFPQQSTFPPTSPELTFPSCARCFSPSTASPLFHHLSSRLLGTFPH